MTREATDGTSDVLHRFERELVQVIAEDATTLYIGGNGIIRSIPKSGGAVTILFSEAPERRSTTAGMAVDADYVYFTGTGAQTLSRVPKAGGARQLLATLAYPEQIALDESYVYVTVTTSNAVVRVPKAGGPVERLAEQQRAPGAIALFGDDVYFANTVNYDEGAHGEMQRVPKTGGAVTTLTNQVVGQVRKIAIIDGSVYYVGRTTRRLTRVPLEGGAPTEVSGVADLEYEITSDATSIYAASLALDSADASLVRYVPATGKVDKLAAWTVLFPRTDLVYPGAKVSYGAIAATSDASRVYWLDFEYDSRGFDRSSLRAAAH